MGRRHHNRIDNAKENLSMDYLFAQVDKIKEYLRNKFILLLLDYDGTLAPIAQTPQKAVILRESKELLEELSKSQFCKIGIISGRSLEDIKKAVGIKNIIYAGNHGLEIEGPKIKFEGLVSPELKQVIHNIAQDLQKKLSSINGVLIEDKGLTLSIHYRLVKEKDLSTLERIFFEITDNFIACNKIKISSGKKVYEIKPPIKWDKGKVALWLMARQQFIAGDNKVLPVYIGDDMTDEDAFKDLKNKGLTVFVGKPGHSAADYYLNDAKEVSKLLGLIFKLKNK